MFELKRMYQGDRKKIVELIPNSDANNRTAEILLLIKNIFNQPLNLLYPLACENKQKAELRNSVARQEESSNDNCEQTCTMRWKLKKRAMHLRDRIAEKTSLNNQNGLGRESVNDILDIPSLQSNQTRVPFFT